MNAVRAGWIFGGNLSLGQVRRTKNSLQDCQECPEFSGWGDDLFAFSYSVRDNQDTVLIKVWSFFLTQTTGELYGE
jgi:hypothetical protein